MAGAGKDIPPSICRSVRGALDQVQHPCAHARKQTGARAGLKARVCRQEEGGLGVYHPGRWGLRPGAVQARSGAAGVRVRILGGRCSGRSHRC